MFLQLFGIICMVLNCNSIFVEKNQLEEYVFVLDVQYIEIFKIFNSRNAHTLFNEL